MRLLPRCHVVTLSGRRGVLYEYSGVGRVGGRTVVRRLMTGGRTHISCPYLVEIVGTAGAGKSTLTRSLHRAEPDWRLADFIDTRTPGHFRYLVHGVPRLFPILTHAMGGRPRLTWREFKLLVYVTEWHRFLQQDPGYRCGVTLLDQGPIYALVRLRAEAGGFTHRVAFERWWEQMLGLWAGELDSIVYLDAADRVLWGRINDRAQPHQAKGEAPWVGQEFIARYRRLFDEVLERVGMLGGPEILRFDTSHATPERLAARIGGILTARLELQRSGAG
jgi:hypothetical protein